MKTTPNLTTVLDHGYIKFIESWGSDERIIESARMSTNKGFQGWKGECFPKNMGIVHKENNQ